MKSLKKLLATLLIVSMLATTQGSFVLAEGMESATKTEENGGTIDPGIVHKDYSGDDASSALDDVEQTTESEEEEKEGEETTTTVKSDDETETSDAETSANESTSEDESKDESKDESTSENQNESTSTDTITETIKKEIADEEDTATASDAENAEENNNGIEENELEEIVATNSDISEEFLFGGDKATYSDASLLELIEFKKPPLGNIDIDYVAPMSDHSELFGTDPLPSRWDSREHENPTTHLSYVPPVRFQNPYGICWAFATAGMFETSIRKKGLATTDAESNLSELALAYFMYNLQGVTSDQNYAGTPGLEGNDYTSINAQYYISRGRAGDANWHECGGNQALSTKMLTAYVGMVVEDDNTEFSNDGNKTQAMINAENSGLPSEYAFGKNAYVPKDIRYINRDDRDGIKKAIMDNGSVGFSYHAEWEEYNDDSPDDYAFHWDDDGSYYHSRNRVDASGRAQTNHAIMIVGWDDSIPKEKFYFGGQGAQGHFDPEEWKYVYTNPPTLEEYNSVTTEGWKSTSDGAWIARNSWSTSPYYLKEGYFYIPYDEPSISETFYSVDAIPADTYKYNYHYDTTAYSGATAAYSFGNVYQVSGEDDNQLIEAVNVGIDDANAVYDIKIYTSNDAMDDPTDGDLKATKRCSNELAGLYTFELDTPVPVEKGTYFSVVFEAVNDSYYYLFCDTTTTSVNSWYHTHNEVEEKQSFRKNSSSSSSWTDVGISSNQNIRLKALGNSGLSVSFNANGGEGTMSSQAMESGVPTALKKNTFKKTGYRFVKWINQDTGDEYEDGAEITITGPVTLTADWEEAHYLLPKNWYNETISGISNENITSIDIMMYPDASPSNVDAAWTITGSGGLIASRRDTDVFIYAPDTAFTGAIDLPADSSFLFSGDYITTDYTDNEHLRNREAAMRGPIPAGSTPPSNFVALENINGLNIINTGAVTNMQGMFYGCESLETADFSNFDTSNVTDMSSMFADSFADGTAYLDLSSFNTSNVTSFNQMFNCIGVKEINISSFDTSNGINLAGMFVSWSGVRVGIEKLDLSNINTSSAVTIMHMISARSVASVSVTSFDTRNVESFEGLFYGMRELTELDVSSFDTSNATDMRWMFNDCPNLTTITASNAFVAQGNTTNMFDLCTSLKGGNGTRYEDGNPKDGTYARIDGKNGLPGYFTSAGSVTVTFDYAGKGTNYSETYEKGETVNRPTDDPTFDGYTFVHWYKEGTSDTVPYDFTVPISQTSAATMRLIAKWTANTYTINLNAKGGIISGDTSFTKTYGTEYTGTIPTPTKTGFAFGGWFIDDGTFEDEYDKSNDEIYVEGQTTPYYIYAKWTAKTYTINYSVESGASVSPTSFTKTYGTAITTDLAVPTKTGYTFINWYKESTFTNVYDKSNDDIYVEGQTTPYNIYAKFNANEYTVDYDLVGIGATKPSTITKTYDSPLADGTLQDPTNIPAGYEFLGWFKSYDSTTGTYGAEWTGSDDLTTGTTTQIIYAKWKRAIVYNVLKNGVDIGATAVPSKEITGETTYNLPSTSATGYTFGGWYGEVGCTTFKGNAGDPITVSDPTTFYAKWTPVSYKIYYKNVDGSTITDGEYVTKTYDSDVTLNTTVTKTGYVFGGWYKDNTTFVNAYDGTEDLASTQDDDKNIYAKWIANEYQVNYNLSGISATAPSSPITKTYGEPLAAGVLKNPTNIPTGYTFAGWYKEATFANEWTGNDDLTTGTTAQTIYARWKAKVTYNANGHGTAPAVVDVYLNDTTELPSMTNVEGYTFDTTNSWYDDSDISTATLIGAAGADYTVTAPKTLYARWNEEEYTITYDKKDGDWTGTAPVGTRKYSVEVTLPVAADIAKNDGTNDYVFKGWYTEDGSTTSWDETKKVTKINANTVAPTGGHKFYARWNPAWKITFNMLGHGAAPSVITVEQGTVVPSTDRPANPTETGYIFSGWYKNYDSTVADFDSRYTNPFDFSTDTVTANTLLYAKWKPITYTISYNANGGTVSPTSDTKTYATALTLAVPTRTGYDFDAWYKNYDATTETFSNPYDGASDISIVQGDTITVYAKWIAHQYTVNYNLNGVGATAPTTPITKTYDEPLGAGVLQNPTNIPSGYEFLGWFKESTTENQWTGSDDLTTGTDPQTIYAKWKRAIVYNVLKNGVDIGADPVPSKEITGETTYNLPGANATGYVFGGWYGEAACTTFKGNAGDPITVSDPTTFYAKWTPIEYEITYNTLGGTLPGTTTNPFTKTYDSPVTLVNPTYEGYDFVGWYANYNATTKAYSNPFDGTTDISTDTTGKTIYAKWTAHTYNINYELSGHATAITPTEKTYGVSYTPPTPTGITDGYKFDGWFKESTHINPYTGDDLTTGTDAQTIYARWKATITYDANGHGVAPAAVDVILGEDTTLPSITDVTGYTFDLTNSWYDGSDVSTATLIGVAGASYTVNAPKKMYARWNENEYTINYDKRDGDWIGGYDPAVAGVTSRKYTEEKTLPVALNIAKTGYTFLGWYKQGDTTETIITKIAANTDETVTVVAKWSENVYNITLNRNEGNYVSGYEVPSTRKYTESKTLPTNDNIKKTGYILVGWYESSDYSGTPVTEVAANTDAHKTFYAKWALEDYVITFNVNGGTINDPAVTGNTMTYNYGTGATLPTNVTKADSVFKGWWTSDGTGGNWGSQVTQVSATDTGAKEYFARWASSYAVTFELLSGTVHPTALANITNAPEAQNIEDGGVAVRPVVSPQAESFEFVDWYTDDTFATVYNFSTPITGATIIYAKWNSVATHEVTFNLMHGTTHPAAVSDITNAPAVQHIVNGRTVTKPIDPTATGYSFAGWYTDDTFATAWNFNSDVVTEPKVVYGKWNEVSYNIAYYENGGTYIDGYTKPISRLYTESKPLPTNMEISKHAYTFGGWYESSTYEGTAITDVAANTARDVTVYAKWSPVPGSRIITFYDNYSGATAEQAFVYGEDAPIRTDVFTRPGWTFIRWKDISGNVYSNTNQLSDGDIALYAEWQQNPQPAPAPTPYNPRSGDSGSSSSSSGRSTSGPIPQNQPTQQAAVTQGAAKQVQVSTSKSEQIVVNGNTSQWQYDPVNNSWKLSALDLMGVPTTATNGFYILSQTVVELVNNNYVPKTVQDTYYFDAKGNMVTGWVNTADNRWYFFNNEKTLDEGKLCIGWKQIDGAWYFFSSNDGSMMTNTTTSDGYKVGADGRWVQ